MDFLETTQSTPVQYTNKNLRAATNNIIKYGQAIRRNWYAIAYTVAGVDRSECYKDDGFDSVHDWTEHAFGIKKSASYTLLTIGRDYTRKIVDEKGKNTRYGSNLVMEGADDFSKTQIEKMLPGGRDLAVELIAAGEITTDMTAREIAKVIKAHKGSDDTQDTKKESEVQETEKESDVQEIELISVWDSEGNEYKVPVSILSDSTKAVMISGYDDPYFKDEISKLIYYIVECDGEERMKKLNITKQHYYSEELAKQWRDDLLRKIHPDNCNHPLAGKATDIIVTLYEGMRAQ